MTTTVVVTSIPTAPEPASPISVTKVSLHRPRRRIGVTKRHIAPRLSSHPRSPRVVRFGEVQTHCYDADVDASNVDAVYYSQDELMLMADQTWQDRAESQEDRLACNELEAVWDQCTIDDYQVLLEPEFRADLAHILHDKYRGLEMDCIYDAHTSRRNVLDSVWTAQRRFPHDDIQRTHTCAILSRKSSLTASRFARIVALADEYIVQQQ